jgi:hypothetical protein
MGTSAVNLSADATSLESAQANVLASSQAMAANLNENLKALYTTAFNNWAISVKAGRISNDKPPAVPKSFVVVQDPVSGFSYPEQRGGPVCDPLPVPPDPNRQPGAVSTLVPNTIDVGKYSGFGGWYAAGPLDTWPPNKKTPPVTLPDGSTRVFMKVPAPVGSQYITLPDGTVMVHGGWYEEVN